MDASLLRDKRVRALKVAKLKFLPQQSEFPLS